MRNFCVVIMKNGRHTLYLANDASIYNEILTFDVEGDLYAYEFSIDCISTIGQGIVLDCTRLKLIYIIKNFENELLALSN